MRKIISAAILILLVSMIWGLDPVEKEAPKTVELSFVGDTLQAVINVPEDMHMAKQPDFVYLDFDPVEGVTLGETIWSEADFIDDLGIPNFKKQAVLKRKITIAEGVDREAVVLKLYVGYQMCYDTYCEPPEELEFELKLPEQLLGKEDK